MKKPIEIKGSNWQVSPNKPEQGRKGVEIRGSNWQTSSDKPKHGRKGIEIKSSPWANLPDDERRKDISRTENKPIKVVSAQWNQINGIQNPNVINQFQGVNELEPFSIKENYATKTKNLTTTKYPALAVRSGNKNIRFKDSGVALSSKIYGLSKYIDLAATNPEELHAIVGDKWIYCTNDSTFVTVKTGMNTQARYSFVQFQGSFTKPHLIVANGYGSPLKYDGGSTLGATLAGAPSGLNHICTHDNRLFGSVGQTVYFSALRKAEDWSTVNDSGSIVVETVDSKPITGLVAGSSRLTVFKKNSIHELFGTNPSNFTMKGVTDSIGCPSGQSVQVIDGIIYFLGNDAIYRYSGGSLPNSDFSIAVKDTIAKINKKSIAGVVASWTSNRRYYLAVCTGTSTTADTILEYDIDFNIWNVWELPNSPSVKGVEVDGYTYVACTDGTVWKMDGSKVTDTVKAEQDMTDTVNDVAWEWVSKPFAFSSLAAKNQWYRMWVVADIPQGAVLNVHISPEKEGDTWVMVQNITAAYTPLQSMEFIVPTDAFVHSNWFRVKLEGTGQVVVYEVARQERTFPIGV